MDCVPVDLRTRHLPGERFVPQRPIRVGTRGGVAFYLRQMELTRMKCRTGAAHGTGCMGALVTQRTKIINSMTHLHNWEGDGRPVLVAHLNIPLEVNIEEFKNEVQFLIRVYDIQQPWCPNKDRREVVGIEYQLIIMARGTHGM